MLKSLMAVAAVAGMMFSSSAAFAGGSCQRGGYYAASYNNCASCPSRIPCTNYHSNYRDCLPRYVAGECMISRCAPQPCAVVNTCAPVCNPCR